MRRPAVPLLLIAFLLLPLLPTHAATAQDAVTCASFDSWVWAQTVLESDPDTHRAALDPDGNGIACETLPIEGFAPTLWADGIPDSAEAAQVERITDGDTFRVLVDGESDPVRMYHMNAPETVNPNRPPQCGGDSSTEFLEMVLGFAPDNIVWLEYDETRRDRYDRRLAYVWFELDGEVYLVNEVMVRNGYAESETYKPDVKYREQLNVAEQFSVRHVLGVRLECGRFGQDLGASPSDEQVAEARRMQPDQGQFDHIDSAPAPEAAAPTGPAQPLGACDPSYPDVCIPPVGIAGDLDCGDIPHRRFRVLPPDPHRFDGNQDGVGCER